MSIVQVELHARPAAETLAQLIEQEGQVESYDFAFVDADKRGYMGYHEQLLKVRRGAVWLRCSTVMEGALSCLGAEESIQT